MALFNSLNHLEYNLLEKCALCPVADMLETINMVIGFDKIEVIGLFL